MQAEHKLLKKGFKFPIYPTEDQKILLERTFGCCRYVWNRVLVSAAHEYKQYLEVSKDTLYGSVIKPDVSGYGFVNRLPGMKSDPEAAWLNDVSAVALQQTMLHLGGAFTRFFREKKGFPKFKKKHNKQSFSLMRQSFSIEDGVFIITKSKAPIKVAFSRPLPSAPSSCTITKTPLGKYFVSFICEFMPVKTHGTGKVGIDLGIKDFATFSTGEKITNPKYFINAQQRLKRAQLTLARKQKGSSNRSKARLKVTKLHEQVSNARRDFHHKLSRRLINENQVVAIEKLMVVSMMKNKRLSKAIADAGWRSFTDMLSYKAIESNHCALVHVSTWYPSSHICHITHKRLERKLTLRERSWDCPYCGQIHDRDITAALNIKHEVISILEIKGLSLADIAGKVVLADTLH